MRNRNHKFVWPVVLSVFICITGPRTTVNAQGTHTTTDADGNSTTTGPSNEYGEGGTHSTTSDKRGLVVSEWYRDKCGRIRELYFGSDKGGGRRSYSDERGSYKVTAVTDKNGETQYE